MELPKFKLCCGGRGCPEVTILPDGCSITDDAGSTITLSALELEELFEQWNYYMSLQPLSA